MMPIEEKSIKEKYGCCGIKMITSILEEYYDNNGELSETQTELVLQILIDVSKLNIL